MPDFKRYGIAGATMATILLTGQVMQMTAKNKSEQIAAVQAMPLPVEISDIELTVADTEPTLQPLSVKSVEQDGTVTAALEAEQAPATREQAPAAASNSCEAKLSAHPKAAALVELNLDAPCMPHERVVFHHNGMMFAEVTDSVGSVRVTVPALAETADFIASFPSGEGPVATTTVEELSSFDRAVVQMQSIRPVCLL